MLDLGKPALWGSPSTLTTPGQALGFPTQRDSGELGEGRGKRRGREGEGGQAVEGRGRLLSLQRVWSGRWLSTRKCLWRDEGRAW